MVSDKENQRLISEEGGRKEKKGGKNADIHIYQPLRSGQIWHKVNFKRSLTGLNSEFSFS